MLTLRDTETIRNNKHMFEYTEQVQTNLTQLVMFQGPKGASLGVNGTH